MRIVLAGSSGYLGRHLTRVLADRGDRVTRLVRRPAHRPDEVSWDPAAGLLDATTLTGADAVINLAGAGIADHRWTPAYRRLIRDSRLDSTRLLAQAVADSGVATLINASAVGWYGDRGDIEVDESAPAATDFLGETCREWEAATAPAGTAGARVVSLRTGHVLAGDSVMSARLRPVFRLGLGGRFGTGRQYFPWIALTDWLRATVFLLDGTVDGPVNLVGPHPVRNSEFVAAFARSLHRRAPFVIPGFALRAVAGEAAVELLRGARIRPGVLLDNGFEFRCPTVDTALSTPG